MSKSNGGKEIYGSQNMPRQKCKRALIFALILGMAVFFGLPSQTQALTNMWDTRLFRDDIIIQGNTYPVGAIINGAPGGTPVVIGDHLRVDGVLFANNAIQNGVPGGSPVVIGDHLRVDGVLFANNAIQNGIPGGSPVVIGDHLRVDGNIINPYKAVTIADDFRVTGELDFPDNSITDAMVKNDITASNYLPLAGGTLTGDLNLASGKKVDGVDISALKVANVTDLTATAAELNVVAGGINFSELTGTATDAQIPDTITVSNYLPLAGGTMSGNLAMGGNNISGVGTLTATTLTDGTATLSGGNLTGAGTVNATTLQQGGVAISTLFVDVAGDTMTGGLNMSNQVISNIGAAGTDFSGTGGLTLADALTVSANGASITGGLNNNNGGITNAGAIAGATTITASGLIQSTAGNIQGVSGVFSTSVITPALIAAAAGDIALNIDAKGTGKVIVATTSTGEIDLTRKTNALAGLAVTNAALTMGTQDITGVGTNLTFAAAGSIATTGANTLGLDTGGAAAINIGAAQANAVNITPATTVTGALTANGAVTLGNGDADAIAIDTSGNFSIASSALNVTTAGAISGATTITASGLIQSTAGNIQGVSGVFSTSVITPALIAAAAGDIALNIDAKGTGKVIVATTSTGDIDLTRNTNALAGLDVTNAALTMGTQDITGVGTNLTFAAAGSIATTGANTLGLDTGGAAAINIGAAQANAVNITPATTVTGLLTANGGLTVANGQTLTVTGATITGLNASSVVNTPAGSIAATDVQAAINELDTEKLALAGGTISGNLQFSGAGSNAGVGLVNAPAQIDAAATDLLTVGTDNQVQRYDFAAGVGAYDYDIDLDAVSAYEGAVFYIYINKAASDNPTIAVRNGNGGADIISLNNVNAENYGCIFVYDGTDWQKHIVALNDL